MCPTGVRGRARTFAEDPAGPSSPVPTSSGADDPPSIRRFVAGFIATLFWLVIGWATLLVAWELLADGVVMAGHRWAWAAAAATAWGSAVGICLSRRGWRGSAVHGVAWGGPAAVLAMPAAAGWVSPDGLVLGVPVTSILASALAMSAGPRRALAAGAGRPASLAGPLLAAGDQHAAHDGQDGHLAPGGPRDLP